MIRYIALLRGINVGGHTVKMDRLREVFTNLGFKNVKSYINSGNIFFDTDNADKLYLTSIIQKELLNSLGFEVPTFLRTTAELEAVVAQDAFHGIELTDTTRFCVTFTQEELSTKNQLPQYSSKNDMELVAINPHEAFIVWHIINGRPPSGRFAATILPPVNTTRFYHTLIKILAAAKA